MRPQLFWEMYLKILMKKAGKKESRRTERTTHRIAPCIESLHHQVCFWIQKWLKLDLRYRQSLSPISKKKKHPTNPVSLVMTNSKPWQRSAGELVKPHQGGCKDLERRDLPDRDQKSWWGQVRQPENRPHLLTKRWEFPAFIFIRCGEGETKILCRCCNTQSQVCSYWTTDLDIMVQLITVTHCVDENKGLYI